jgi:hypothetical protein
MGVQSPPSEASAPRGRFVSLKMQQVRTSAGRMAAVAVVVEVRMERRLLSKWLEPLEKWPSKFG